MEPSTDAYSLKEHLDFMTAIWKKFNRKFLKIEEAKRKYRSKALQAEEDGETSHESASTESESSDETSDTTDDSDSSGDSDSSSDTDSDSGSTTDSSSASSKKNVRIVFS
nr:unnamed protein product [Spirometra erinaceieuropaei]